ncbi:MAG: energy-coupling factor transporter transmembrane component T family protein [Gemmataceae bacterium]
MKGSLTTPEILDSPLSRMDGRWRLAWILGMVLGTVLVRSLPGCSALFGLSVLMLLVARVDAGWYVRRLKVFASVLVLVALPMAMLANQGGWLTLKLILKATAIFNLTAILLVTAPLERTFHSAQGLGVHRTLIHLGLLSHRYLFLLADELRRLRVALKVRGFRNRMTLHGYHAVSSAMGTLLVRGYERSEKVEIAMRSRGFQGAYSSLSQFRTRWSDVVITGGLLLGVVLVVGYDWRFGS